jgi:D-alanyl-D-alanine dipeptidase
MYKYIHILLSLIIGFSSCSEGKPSNSEKTKKSNISIDKEEKLPIADSLIVAREIADPEVICEWDTYFMNLGLVNIHDIDSTIKVELKYSTTDNFMGADVYGCLENCYLQPDVAERLKKCQEALQIIDSNLSLLLYDGLRPRLVQQHMWDLLDMPINEKVKFVSNPKKGSLHNFGAAVDITLYDLTTQMPLDMGTPYDYIGVLAWPAKEPAMLRDSLLTRAQVDHRILLRRSMKAGTFFNIQTEWWHFNACYRDKAKELYHIVEGDSNLVHLPTLD